MAARASSRRRWFLRDVPRTYVLFVWLAFGLAIFLYAYDWRPSGWSPAVAGSISARSKLNKYLAESVAVTYPLKSRFGNALGNNVQVSFISASAPAAQAAGWLRCGLAGRLYLFGTKST